MSLGERAFLATAVAIMVCCISVFLLLRSEFHLASVVLDLEAQELQEQLSPGWRVLYHHDWATIETFLDDPSASLWLELPLKDAYLMKIKARFAQAGQQVTVSINGLPVTTLVSTKGHRAEKFLFKVPAKAVRQGRNVVTFTQGMSPMTIAFEQVAMRNFLCGDEQHFVLALRMSRQLPLRRHQLLTILGFWIACVVLTGMTTGWFSKAMKLPLGPLLLLDLFAYMPLIIVLGVFLGLSTVSPYPLVLGKAWFPFRMCLMGIGLPKLYLLGVVGKRYAELVKRTVSAHGGTAVPHGRVDFVSIWASSRNQSLSVSMGVVGIFILVDTRQRWQRICRRLHWWGRVQPGNGWLLGFLGLWILSALVLIVLHLPRFSEQIVNVAAVFLIIALVAKWRACWRAEHGRS